MLTIVHKDNDSKEKIAMIHAEMKSRGFTPDSYRLISESQKRKEDKQ